jgi:hypothetical protein
VEAVVGSFLGHLDAEHRRSVLPQQRTLPAQFDHLLLNRKGYRLMPSGYGELCAD